MLLKTIKQAVSQIKMCAVDNVRLRKQLENISDIKMDRGKILYKIGILLGMKYPLEHVSDIPDILEKELNGLNSFIERKDRLLAQISFESYREEGKISYETSQRITRHLQNSEIKQ